MKDFMGMMRKNQIIPTKNDNNITIELNDAKRPRNIAFKTTATPKETTVHKKTKGYHLYGSS